VPDAEVSLNSVEPWAARPAGLANIASCSLPSCWGWLSPGTLAEIVPSAAIDTDWASVGIVISPWTE